MEHPISLTQETVMEAAGHLNIKALGIQLAKNQPNILLALAQRYGYIPTTASILYATIEKQLGGAVSPVPREAVDALLEQVDKNREELISKFTAEQPVMAKILTESYGYIPAPAFAVYFLVMEEIVSDHFQNMLKQIETPTDIPSTE